jgi:signal transduction histidine kinase
MAIKSPKIKTIFVIYWILLCYIIAALIWWYIALSQQNTFMSQLKLKELSTNDASYFIKRDQILAAENRKHAQYAGEGAIFLLLIWAGAIFLYRAVKKQLKLSAQQQSFMMAITHELKTPIAITKLNLETLQKRKLDDQQHLKLLNNTIQEANRLDSLCNNLLLSSQMEAGGHQLTLEKINLAIVLQNCVFEFQNRFTNRNFISNIESEFWVMGDQFLLQMAINNLLDNAVKYSGKASNIFIQIEQKKQMGIVKISDEGAGIADEEKKHVFKKYYRLGTEATQKAKGTGLGLFLVSRIVKAHKATIHIEDHQPNGATFVIELKGID